jgi:predicted deacylase
VARANPSRIVIGGTEVAPGERATIDLPLARVFSHLDLNMVVQVVRGRRSGPTLCVAAGIHGDEINGVEIVRRLLRQKSLARMRGTLIAVPVVNVFGFIQQTRYLPDRRDLNRSFPGSERGSLAARLAHLFMNEVIAHCDYCIDLHTAAVHRTNLPQIRATLNGNEEVTRLARAFGAPVIIDSKVREGSLREATLARGIPLILYEAGEALRIDDIAVRAGVRGTLSVMREIGMLAKSSGRRKRHPPTIAIDSSWVRATGSGMLQSNVKLGAHVREGDLLGRLMNPYGEGEFRIVSDVEGIVIGMTQIPLLNEGDAAFHVAEVKRPTAVEKAVEAFQGEHTSAPG